MEKLEKTLFVESTELVNINGDSNVPTALCYLESGKCFGYAALEKSEGNIVNTEFKVDLGEYDLQNTSKKNKMFETAEGGEKSSFELAKDFINMILDNVEGQAILPAYDRKGLKILVSEPLAFQIEDRGKSWIKNYRDNIERILHRYDIVEFLPEPFAVYQYYRYGLKIPQLLEASKQVALIIDFGGGTFDVSVIESTRTGDISKKGKFANPLSASSEPFGGFFINEKIAEYLILRRFESDSEKRKSSQFFKTYLRYKKGELDFDALNDEKKSFIRNIKKLSRNVEAKKIELCKKIVNWDLKADCYEKVLIEVPDNPYIGNSKWHTVSLFGHELRTIFRNEIWEPRIKKVLKSAISRAKESLKDKHITITLISGGSSNIRWLEKFIIEEFKDDLGRAAPIPLSQSFQEIVAKGLAIECARRHYDPDSEFV